ncbi:MAG: S1C family serine protease [Candidatus Promineifilaceae bacterium]|jgi:serine protease Do
MISKLIGGFILWLAPVLLFVPAALLLPEEGTAKTKPSAMAIPPFNESQALLENELNTVDVVTAIGPSVAAINVSVPGNGFMPFGNTPPELLPPQFRELLPYLDDEAPVQQGSGSGFVVDLQDERFLVTNYHVVQDALRAGTTRSLEGTSITAVFPGGEKDPIELRVVGANPSFDLALLTGMNGTDAFEGIAGITIADSDNVRVGQKSIAIGNPFGLESTVTTGIISAVERFAPSVGRISVPMLQTDAAINPGNSGGPLLNSQGQLIGVNTSIINPEGPSSAGLGFAVPSNLLVEALANLELGGLSDIRDTRPTFGARVQTIGTLPKGIREALNLPDDGVLIIDVLPGSPADKAGILGSTEIVTLGSFQFETGGDVITAINGEALNRAEQLNLLVSYESKVGDELLLDVLRNGESITLTVTVEVMP